MASSNPRSFYSKTMDVATPGALSGDPIAQINKAYVNGAATAKEVHTVVTPATVDASTTYSITVDGVTVSYTSDASPTQAELRDGLYNAFRTNPEARSLMSIAISGNNLLLTSARLEDTHTVSVNSGATTNDLSVSITTAQNLGTAVPYGVFVARASGDALGYAKLPTANTDKVLGITTIHRALERSAIGDQGTTEYKALEVMDVVERCNSLDGVWVRCVDSDITIDDTVYVIPSGATAGYVTKTAGSNINLSSQASFQSGTETINRDNTGTYMVLVRFNKV
jgi:hypothetical protein